jgi:hypothetical protein
MTASVVANLIAGFALVVGLVVTLLLVKQLRLLSSQIAQAREAFVSEQERIRKQATFEYLAATTARREQLTRRVPSKRHVPRAGRLVRVLRSRQIAEMLNYYEEFAAAVDVNVVDRILGGTIVAIDDAYGSSFPRMREELDSPYIYAEVSHLAETIRSRRGVTQ